MKVFKLRYFFIVLVTEFIVVSVFGITANFSYSKRSNCAPAIVEFVNTSTYGSGIIYTWDFGLGAIVTTSDNSNKEQIYSKPGQYKVTLTVSDGVSSQSISATITIAQGPKARFVATPVSGCKPLLVNYSSTSIPGDSAINKISWDFRNGNYGTGTTVQYTYGSSGKYSVIMKVTDKNGCSGTTESDSIITVVDPPVTNFTASDTFTCTQPLNVSFINLSTGSGNLTYFWDFGNGKTSTMVSTSSVYSTKGAFDVKLAVTDQNGCTDTMIKKSYINIGYPAGSLSVYDAKNNIVNTSKLCSGLYKFVFSVSNLPDYIWTIRDNSEIKTFSGTNSISYLVKDTGALDIILLYGKESECTDVIHKVFSKSQVKASFSMDTVRFCSLPQLVNLQNSSDNAAQYSWYFSNKVFSDKANTSYTITAKDLNPATYEQLYNHLLDTITMPFKLKVINSDGCADSATKEISIIYPLARFMPDKVSGCIPLEVTISDSSQSVYKVDEYTYKTGTKTIATTDQKSVKYTFTEPGEYYIVEIIKSNGCIDTSHFVKIEAGDRLKPDFTVSPQEVCNGGQIHITGTSNNNSVVDSWHFQSSNIFDHVFTALPDTSFTVYSDSIGNKDISLQIDYNGCFSDTTKKAAFKIIGLVGNFTQAFSCDSPLVYRFKSKISPVTSLTWNVDTAIFKDKDSVRYKFPISGDYTVKLTASDNASGCNLTRTKLIKVRQIKAGFTLTDSIYCVGDSVKLDASTSVDYINSCYNEGFLWDFGNNSPPRRTYATSYAYVYSQRGTYKIQLVAQAENGCVDSTSKMVYIHKPIAGIEADKKFGCVPSLNVNFSDTSKDTTIVSSIWDFGDGVTDSSGVINILHTYTSGNQTTYNATLKVYDVYQCYSNYTIPITLIAINADFQADDNAICFGNTVTFSPVDKKLDSLIWTFGDGISSVDSTHTYNKYGLFTVSLVASKEGCRDTFIKADYISVEKADASFLPTDSVIGCYQDTALFIQRSTNGSLAVDWLWTIDSQDLPVNSDTLKYIFTHPATYNVQVAVKTLNGCKADSSRRFLITGPTASYSFDPRKICYNEMVNFKLDSLKNVTSLKWLFGDGTSSNENPASHRYSSRGKIIPAVVLINGNCSITKTMDTLEIAQVKADFTGKPNVTKICKGDSIDFINTSSNSSFWAWRVNGVLRSEDLDFPDVLLPNIGDNYIKLIASDSANCTDTIVKIFTVVDDPKFTIIGDSILCKDQNSITLLVNPDSGWTIKWTPSTGLSSTNAFTVTAQPSVTTTYKAKVTDANGCSATQVKTINVNQLPNFIRIPLADTTINFGQTIQLIIQSDSSLTYTWSPDYYISCLDCNNPYVSPAKDVTYKVEIANNCVQFTENFNITVNTDFYLVAPSAFTPNGDSYNDVFKLETLNIKTYELKIFNRWGKIVFSTNDIKEGWDGKVNGILQNVDTYTYYVKAETNYGYKIEKKGNFLLLK